ncbi:MAG: hypothetical protein RQ715_00690 [Methylococcales bacterium]|nr:hypothetical protein [Methylococcales bacterium]
MPAANILFCTRRATHLDQLTDQLKEPRVHRVIAAILPSEDADLKASADDLQYCEDLGLVTTRPQLRIANHIYQEIIPRELSWPKQVMICHEHTWYLDPGRRLNLPWAASAPIC